MARRWYVYHSRLSCRASDPLQVRPCEWTRQCICASERDAVTAAQNLATQGVHARISSRAGTQHFPARAVVTR